LIVFNIHEGNNEWTVGVFYAGQAPITSNKLCLSINERANTRQGVVVRARVLGEDCVGQKY